MRIFFLHFARSSASSSITPAASISSLIQSSHLLFGLPLFLLPTTILLTLFPTYPPSLLITWRTKHKNTTTKYIQAHHGISWKLLIQKLCLPVLLSVTKFISNTDGNWKYLEFPSTAKDILWLFELELWGEVDIFSTSPIDFTAFETAAADKLPVISLRHRSLSDIRCWVAITVKKTWAFRHNISTTNKQVDLWNL